MIEVKDNVRLDYSIEDSNYEFDGSKFLTKLGFIAAGTFAIGTGMAYMVGADAMTFASAATSGLWTMGTITTAVGVMSGAHVLKSIKLRNIAIEHINHLAAITDERGLCECDLVEMEDALKNSDIVTIVDTKTVDDKEISRRTTKYMFASPETSVIDNHKYTYIYRQETNNFYNDDGNYVRQVENIGIVETEDFKDPRYADDLALAVGEISGNLTRKKRR